MLQYLAKKHYWKTKTHFKKTFKWKTFTELALTIPPLSWMKPKQKWRKVNNATKFVLQRQHLLPQFAALSFTRKVRNETSPKLFLCIARLSCRMSYLWRVCGTVILSLTDCNRWLLHTSLWYLSEKENGYLINRQGDGACCHCAKWLKKMNRTFQWRRQLRTESDVRDMYECTLNVITLTFAIH